MKSGITRYTKGALNESAIMDVYNKAKEIYQDEVTTPPPVDGIEFMTHDDIWDEMWDEHDHPPLASALNIGQMQGVRIHSCGPQGFAHGKWYETWHQAVPWCEVEVASTTYQCNPPKSNELSESSNTAVMLGKSYYYMKYDGEWELRVKKMFDKAQWQPGDVKRNACIPDCADVTSANYKWFGPNDEAIFNLNSWGNWWHPYPAGGDKKYWKDKDANGNWKSPDAIAHCFYAKLVLIDPDGIDDRHLAKFLIHVSQDKYIKENPDGTTALDPDNPGTGCVSDPIHCNDWDVTISKYKNVTNDWQLFIGIAPNIELRYPDYGLGNDTVRHLLDRDDFDFYWGDFPIPTEPL